MQATLQLSAEIDAELRANRGPALPKPSTGWVVGHPAEKCVCIRIDWPAPGVEFPVTVLVRNRNQAKARRLHVIFREFVSKTPVL